TPTSQLPEEEYLQIKVPRLGLFANVKQHDYYQNEMGNYALDDTLDSVLHGQVFLEMWGQLFRFLFSDKDPVRNVLGHAVHIYGDKKSVKMYSRLGFHILRVYYRKGKFYNYTNLAEKDVPGIKINDNGVETEWWPMVLLPSDLANLNKRYSNQGASSASGDWLVQRRRDLSSRYVGAFQMGAQLPHLLEDINSENPDIVVNALDSYLDILNSFAVLHKTLRDDGERNEETVTEIIKLFKEAQLTFDEIISVVQQKILVEEDYHLILMGQFIGFFLKLENLQTYNLFISKIIDKCLWPLLMRSDVKANVFLFHALNTSLSSIDWLNAFGVIEDYSLIPIEFKGLIAMEPDEWSDPKNLVPQVNEIKSRSEKIIKDKYQLPVEQLQEITSLLRKNLFVPPATRKLHENEVYYLPTFEIWDRTAIAFHGIKEYSPELFRHLFIMAAAQQFIIENQ
ncbi:MAG: hypothetical protein KDD40_10325, partial [Bdellovibrionales bacterium]|nr:hypothetical protein [Bdellovibrionales bacterium]